MTASDASLARRVGCVCVVVVSACGASVLRGATCLCAHPGTHLSTARFSRRIKNLLFIKQNLNLERRLQLCCCYGADAPHISQDPRPPLLAKVQAVHAQSGASLSAPPAGGVRVAPPSPPMVSTFSCPAKGERPAGGAHRLGRPDRLPAPAGLPPPLVGFFLRRHCNSRGTHGHGERCRNHRADAHVGRLASPTLARANSFSSRTTNVVPSLKPHVVNPCHGSNWGSRHKRGRGKRGSMSLHAEDGCEANSGAPAGCSTCTSTPRQASA